MLASKTVVVWLTEYGVPQADWQFDTSSLPAPPPSGKQTIVVV